MWSKHLNFKHKFILSRFTMNKEYFKNELLTTYFNLMTLDTPHISVAANVS